MKEIKDHEQLQYYLDTHQLETVFNGQLKPYLMLLSFDQREPICTRGDTLEYLYVLVKGKIKIYTTSAEGKTLILCFRNPLEVIGDVEYFQGIDIINSVEAVSPVYLIAIHQRWLNQYGNQDATLLQFLLKIMTQKFYFRSSFSSFNLMYPVEVRLASYLLSVSYEDTESHSHLHSSTFNLGDAAHLIGISYRHLNRVIRKMCADGLVERTKGNLLIKDREGLIRMAGHNIYE